MQSEARETNHTQNATDLLYFLCFVCRIVQMILYHLAFFFSISS